MIGFPPVPTGSPAPPGLPRRWTLSAADGHTLSGYLPPWAGDDPSEHNVPVGELADRLADIHHCARFPGQTAAVYTAADRTGRPCEQEILSCTLDCTPYAEPPEPRVPVVNLHLCEESWITDLDPDGLLRVADLLRAQADRLDRVVRPALLAARNDWSAQGAPGPGGPGRP
ncbi:hypothetical protein SAMN05216223_10586 [Actinacidiphila yanglinensis]|uniref:Uncharacterized protein n=1 Tax=Actinacidiphila yanglinensis TaxID=310779 RepID=A0A1H6A132_9ACTN|nr:hypothetical protein [Actinacidiphila yanglinensis]SEG42151.1 hypothetical protein SAMN05216223_10586 [Actinacidiphila yanglinensis]